ncbi:winged helix-turn-helix domain-containing protein [Streptomyces sp. NPDC002602]|uniref:winged helix-turn-helix domain-containing protein n=1 Tax=Streptomyces sp. NPDC002602 TaxID=3364654 RepID=UPI0036937854
MATLIGRKFHVIYSVSGATRLMHRVRFSPQVPAWRVAERDERAVTAWKVVTWAEVKGPGGLWGLRPLRGRSRLHPTVAPGSELGLAGSGRGPTPSRADGTGSEQGNRGSPGPRREGGLIHLPRQVTAAAPKLLHRSA